MTLKTYRPPFNGKNRKLNARKFMEVRGTVGIIETNKAVHSSKPRAL